MFDIQSLIKYLLEGLAVAVAAYFIPQVKVQPKEIILIALTAASVFAVLDQFAPAVAAGARQGAGFGIGFGQFGGMGLEGFDNRPVEGLEDLEGYDDYEGFLSSQAPDMHGMPGEMGGMSGEMDGMSGEMDGMPRDIGGMPEEIGEMGMPCEEFGKESSYGVGVGDDESQRSVCLRNGDQCSYSPDATDVDQARYLCKMEGDVCRSVPACKMGDSGECDWADENFRNLSDAAGRMCQTEQVDSMNVCRLSPMGGQGGQDAFDGGHIEGFSGWSITF